MSILVLERPRGVTIRFEDRLALARGYCALLAYPGEPQRDARDRFIEAAKWLAAALSTGHGRRDAPRKREVESALRPGLKRIAWALELARLMPFDASLAAAVLAEVRTSRRTASAAPVRKSDVRGRELAPALPVLHLGLPLVAARLGVAEFELAPRGIPERVADLLTNPDWPVAALAAAELWRRGLAMPELIEVRARSLDIQNVSG